MSDEPPKEEAPKEEKRGANGFKPGTRGGSVFKLMQARKGVPYKEPKKDGAPEELITMRHVMLNGKKYDLTEHQIFLRKIKEGDPKAFLGMINTAEEKHRKAKEEKKQAAVTPAHMQVEPAPAVEHDAGTARCIALCEQLMEEASR